MCLINLSMCKFASVLMPVINDYILWLSLSIISDHLFTLVGNRFIYATSTAVIVRVIFRVGFMGNQRPHDNLKMC